MLELHSLPLTRLQYTITLHHFTTKDMVVPWGKLTMYIARATGK